MEAKDTVMGNRKLQLLEKQYEGDVPTHDFDHYLLLAQAKFTYPIAVRETLKMVGEWLAVRLHVGGHGDFCGGDYHENYIGLVEDEVNALKKGEMPGLNQSGEE